MFGATFEVWHRRLGGDRIGVRVMSHDVDELMTRLALKIDVKVGIGVNVKLTLD